ncbi:hypothetical protein H7I76_09440 [Mycolicibacterium vaccae]|nr:hypothetical protein [Mycolicibacterium vaccae]
MDTYILGPPRWRILRALGRNPLVRTSDRIEALVWMLAAMVSMLAIPAARDRYRGARVDEQPLRRAGSNRHLVPATVIDGVATNEPSIAKTTITVDARWFVVGAIHRHSRRAPTVRTGDQIDVWVDDNGRRVAKPTPVCAAATDAALVALAIWLTVDTAAATLYMVTRWAADRCRAAGWQRDIDILVGHGGGRANSQR